MKTSQLLITVALLLGSASISFAGPGAQYWQQHRTATTQKPAPVAAATTTGAMNEQPCNCQGSTSCHAKG